MNETDRHLSDYDAHLAPWVRERTIVLDTVDSTNRFAKDWALKGGAPGSIVLAHSQSEGKGRLGRTWTAERGSSVLLSIIVELPELREHIGRLAIGISLAVANAIESVCATVCPTRGIVTSIKWPNDTLIDGRKCAGILIENVSGKPSTYIVGVGINVVQSTFPESLRLPATSISLATGKTVARSLVVGELIRQMDKHIELIARHAIEDDAKHTETLRQYRSRLLGLNSFASFQATDTASRIHGIFRGVSDGGALLLETDGAITEYWSGDVFHGVFESENSAGKHDHDHDKTKLVDGDSISSTPSDSAVTNYINSVSHPRAKP